MENKGKSRLHIAKSGLRILKAGIKLGLPIVQSRLHKALSWVESMLICGIFQRCGYIHFEFFEEIVAKFSRFCLVLTEFSADPS